MLGSISWHLWKSYWTLVTRKTCRDLLWVFKLFLIENDFWHWSQGKRFYLQYSRVLVWVFKLFLTVNNFWHWSQGKCFIFSRVEFFYESSNCFWLRMTFDIDHKENILLWIFEIAISWKLLWTLITLKRFLTSVGSFINFKIAISWEWLLTLNTKKTFFSTVEYNKAIKIERESYFFVLRRLTII